MFVTYDLINSNPFKLTDSNTSLVRVKVGQ